MENGQDVNPSDYTDPVIQGLYQTYKYFESLEKEATHKKHAALMALRACGADFDTQNTEWDTPFRGTTLSKERFDELGKSNGYKQSILSRVFNALEKQSQSVIYFNTTLPHKELWKSLFDENNNLVFDNLAMLSDNDLLRTHRIGKTGLGAIKLIVTRVIEDMTTSSAESSDTLAQND